MENRAGRGRERHGEAAGGRGPGARGGRRHNGKKEGGPGHGAAGDRQGMLRRHGEEANAGGGADCSGGRASHNGERPNLGGQLQEEADDGEEENASRGKSDAESQQALALKVRAKGPTLEPGELQEEPEDAEEGNASGGKADAEPGSLGFAGPGERPNLGGELQEELQHAEEENASGHSADAQPGSLGLGGPGDQSVQRGEKKETSRTLSTAPADDAPFVSSGVPSGGGADLVDASATSKEQTICSAVVPEEKKLGSTATATPTSTLPPSTFLTEAVLSWTIRNVLDDNLYKEKVKCIPAKFDSTQHIIDVYSAIIMEETRSVISSRIQNKTGTQYCQLKSIKQCASPHVYYLDVDLQMTRSDEIHCHHIAKDFDVCLLSPKCSNDPDLDVMSCSLGLVIGVGRDTYYQKSFRVLVSNSEMFQQERTRFVGFLTNIKYNMEIAKIMSLPENGNNIAVQALMDLYKTVGEKCKICSVSHCNDDLASINKKTGEYNVTSVISNITSSLSCAHQNHTEVVWAPPRTMKVCISALMKSFLHLRLRVLVCLPKKELISDFLTDIDDFLGSSDAFGDVVVLNSLRGLDNCSNFERAFLENRSHELYCCLRLCKCSLKVMSNLLDLSGFHHSPRCLDFVTCKRCSNLQLIPFSVKLFAERFMDIFMHLNKYLVYLVNNSSVFCLSREHCDNIEELLDLMKQLEAILYNKDLREDFVEVALKLIPAVNGDVEDNIDSIAKSLNENRISCLRLIAKLSDSLELPQLEDLNDVDRLCIQHSKIIIASFDSMWKLHELEMDAFDMLIVSGSNQIKDLDLLLPLNLPVHHTIFFGDHFLAPPVVESKLCKEAGFGKSIYERLQQLTTQQQILTHQYGRHEFIDEIINCHIYNGILEVSPNAMSMEHNTEVESLSFPSFSVMNVPTIPSSYSRKGYVLSATLFILLQKLSKDLINSDRKFSICVVCFSSNEVSAIRDLLRTENMIDDKLYLEVRFIGDLEGIQFDLIVISTIVEHDYDLNCVNKNLLNVALTITRRCCCMVGRCNALVKSGGIWKKLVQYAAEKKLLKAVRTDELTEVVKKFKNNGADHKCDANYIFSKEMPGQEFTWVDRPYGTKYILAAVRDQRGQPDTCTIQASCGAVESLMKLHNASLSPPQDCRWNLSVDDLKIKYETSVGKKLRSEDIADRGKRRLSAVLESFKTHGVVGRNKTHTKSRIIKILSYEKVDHRDTEGVTKLLEEGNIMVGHFRLSWNYFTLKPGEVYVFDEKKAFIHPNSNLVASHAVMMVGVGHRRTGRMRFTRHMAMQNSEGKMFGINGIGRVGKSQTVRGLYRMVVDMPDEGLLDS